LDENRIAWDWGTKRDFSGYPLTFLTVGAKWHPVFFDRELPQIPEKARF
jgi:hypothetical protein